MRKMYKRRSCGVCKPRKRGIVKRWSLRDERLLREFDRERTHWQRRNH
jgi:hypothetical protein